MYVECIRINHFVLCSFDRFLGWCPWHPARLAIARKLLLTGEKVINSSDRNFTSVCFHEILHFAKLDSDLSLLGTTSGFLGLGWVIKFFAIKASAALMTRSVVKSDDVL